MMFIYFSGSHYYDKKLIECLLEEKKCLFLVKEVRRGAGQSEVVKQVRALAAHP